MLRQPLVIEKCTDELWEGVSCDLPAGHKGPHHRAACDEGAALSWRSSASGPRRPAHTSQEQLPMFKLTALAR